MSGGSQLILVIDRIERIQAEIQRTTARIDQGRKLVLVGLRRELAVELGNVVPAAERQPAIMTDPVRAAEFRARFSALRSAIALHQSQWPAVMLDETSGAHDESIRRVRRASLDFIVWTRDLLKAHS